MSRNPADAVGAAGRSAGGGGPCWSLETSLEMRVERSFRPARLGGSSAFLRAVECIGREHWRDVVRSATRARFESIFFGDLDWN